MKIITLKTSLFLSLFCANISQALEDGFVHPDHLETVIQKNRAYVRDQRFVEGDVLINLMSDFGVEYLHNQEGLVKTKLIVCSFERNNNI